MLVINASTVSLVQILKLLISCQYSWNAGQISRTQLPFASPNQPLLHLAKFDICINSTKNPHLFVDTHELLGGGLVGKIISDSLTEPWKVTKRAEAKETLIASHTYCSMDSNRWNPPIQKPTPSQLADKLLAPPNNKPPHELLQIANIVALGLCQLLSGFANSRKVFGKWREMNKIIQNHLGEGLMRVDWLNWGVDARLIDGWRLVFFTFRSQNTRWSISLYWGIDLELGGNWSIYL